MSAYRPPVAGTIRARAGVAAWIIATALVLASLGIVAFLVMTATPPGTHAARHPAWLTAPLRTERDLASLEVGGPQP